MSNYLSRTNSALVAFSHGLNWFGALAGGMAILLIAILVTYEVIMRFVFQAPTHWILEVSIYLCIASVFLSTGYTQNRKNHIYVDVVVDKLRPYDRFLTETMTTLLSITYLIVLAWQSGEFALHAFQTNEVSPTPLAVPMYIPWMLLPLGSCLLLVELFSNLLSLLDGEVQRRAGSGQRGNSLVPGFFPWFFVVMTAVGIALMLSPGNEIFGFVMLLFLLLFSGMPVSFAMGFLGTAGFFLVFGGWQSLPQVPILAYRVLDDFILVAVPCFLMASVIMMVSGIGAHLFDVASKWTRHLPGGLAVAAILASAIFCAISGSSTATVATIGLIALPEMLSRGYPRQLSYGTITIGGVLGPLIPPSIFMLVIGSMTGDSVGKLFMAGMIPGLLMAAVFIVYIVWSSARNKNIPKMEKCSLSERLTATRQAVWGLLAPVMILGGIYSGIFTPTEAAAIGVTYCLFVAFAIYKTLGGRRIVEILLESAKITSMILFIVAGAVIFGQVATLMEVPQTVLEFLGDLPLPPLVILAFVLLFILVLGALMDELSILLITYPTLHYVFVQGFGFDPIWFAVVFVVTLGVGLVAPPVGINIFVTQGLDKTAKFMEVVRGVSPFIVLMLIVIVLVVAFESISLWLPGLMY